MATKTDRPKVLIEQWLPIAEIGVERMRERGASSALPPLYFLHVRWARRPLTVCREAILASRLGQVADRLRISSGTAASIPSIQPAQAGPAAGPIR